MKTYIVVVESTDSSRTYDDLDDRLSKHYEAKSKPCHVLGSAWCVRSDKDIKEIYGFLGKLVDINDRFVIASVDEDWLVRNAKSKSDCFDLND